MPKLAETLDGVLREKLVKAGQKVRRSRMERDELIADAAESGASLREIAIAVGISYETVRRIVARERGV